VTFGHTNQYLGIDNISERSACDIPDVTQFVSSSSDFSSKTLGAGFEIGYPISSSRACASA
jgi:hypothetical protein